MQLRRSVSADGHSFATELQNNGYLPLSPELRHRGQGRPWQRPDGCPDYPVHFPGVSLGRAFDSLELLPSLHARRKRTPRPASALIRIELIGVHRSGKAKRGRPASAATVMRYPISFACGSHNETTSLRTAQEVVRMEEVSP